MRLIACAAAAMLGSALTGPLAAQSAPPPDTPAAADAPAAAPTTAPAYLQMASSGDMFETQSSQLALQVSRSAPVKDLARMIIADHTRLSEELVAAAQGAGIAAPQPKLAPHHAQMLDQLRATPAARFDQLYLQHQLAAHQEALGIHRSYAASGDVPALRSAASQAAPAIEMHLQRVQALPARGLAGAGHKHVPTPERRPGKHD